MTALLPKSRKKTTFFSLFSGGGGFSVGFEQAGFKLIGASDIDVNSEGTHMKNWPNIPFLKEDIRKLSSKGILRLTKGQSPDIIIGGPPCQAYSSVGKARLSLERANVDPRTVLYKQYIRLVKEFQPHYFVFENVPAIQSTRDGEIIKTMEKKFKKMGYNFEPQVLNSKDYYILQNRKRMIMVGWSKEVDGEYPQPLKKENNYQVAEIFKDLPHLKPGEGKDVGLPLAW